MKINILSRLILTVVFGGMFFLNSCKAVVEEPTKAKNIIFLIGDGMGISQVHAALTANGGTLALEGITTVGLQKTYSANKYNTDSAASGTAMACGKKTKNGMIGVDSLLNPLESILVLAEEHGKSTGLIATASVTHATPASFIAHENSRGNVEAIAADYLDVDIDLFVGGGMDHFTKRADSLDLTETLTENGYTVLSSVEDFAKHKSGKVAVLTAPVHNPSIIDGRGDMLPIATKKALELLSQNEEGFFIMIEGSMIDWGGHGNDQDYVITETLDFDKAVKVALDFAKEDGETLVVVTADHETGGMVVLNGDYEKKTVKTTFTTGGHTGVLIPVYSYGPGSENFSGIFNNIDFKGKFIDAYGIEIQE